MSKLFNSKQCKNTQFGSVCPIGNITPGQDGPGSDENERVLRITQSSTAQSAGAVEYTVCFSAEG